MTPALRALVLLARRWAPIQQGDFLLDENGDYLMDEAGDFLIG
jgi:hypothetical protein